MDGFKTHFTTDSGGLGNGLDMGVRESEESKKKKTPHVSGTSNY